MIYFKPRHCHKKIIAYILSILLIASILSLAFIFDIHIIGRILAGIAFVVSSFFSLLEIIYLCGNLSKPLRVDTGNDVLLYFNEYHLRQKAVDIRRILEMDYEDDAGLKILTIRITSRDGDTKEEINVSAYMNCEISRLIKVILELNPKIVMVETAKTLIDGLATEKKPVVRPGLCE